MGGESVLWLGWLGLWLGRAIAGEEPGWGGLWLGRVVVWEDPNRLRRDAV